MKIGGIIVLSVLFLVFVAFFMIIRIFNKLTLKKIATEIAYVKIDDLFIARYERLPELFSVCENSQDVSAERELAINSKTAEERVEHDKKMASALSNLIEGNEELKASVIVSELKELEGKIAEAYAEYNTAVDDYEAMRSKPAFKFIVKFFSFEIKPHF